MTPTKLNNRIWAISPHAFAEVQRTLAAASQPDAMLTLADMVVLRPEMDIDETATAHVYVQGALGDKMPNIWGMVGNTDYRQLRDEIAVAKEVGSTSLALHIDSPGGMVAGLEEVGEAIADSNMHVTAYVDGMACSAAYYLACQADSIVATPSSEVGNIGTVLAWADDKPAWESMGIEFNVLTNEGADLKGTFRDSPMTDSQREFLQQGINEAGADFRRIVEGNRDVDPEVFRAGWYSGDRALALGLIDTIS